MTIASILRGKPAGIFSVEPADTVGRVTSVLASKRVGALVVLDRARQLLGIVSERDVMRCLAAEGARALDMTAAQIMTANVHTVAPDTGIETAMLIMTNNRVRHLPVVDGGSLVGMISIGDVVKQQLDRQAHEVDTLRDYVSGRI